MVVPVAVGLDPMVEATQACAVVGVGLAGRSAVLMRLVDIILGIPYLVLALAMVAVLGKGISAEDAEVMPDPDYVRAAHVLPDMECFDAGFFGFSPRDASNRCPSSAPSLANTR